MKAIVYDKYGPPNALEFADIDRPVAKDDEALVRVRASPANAYGWDLPAGLRYVGRMTIGRRKPGRSVAGLGLAGQVEAIGKDVTRFRPGDEVSGWCKGALAEYASVSEDALALKPANLTFEQAAVVPTLAVTALQALRDKGHLQAGQRVLIVGASGGVGTFAVQLARARGAHVTGVCSTRNVDMVRSIGADHVIDYTREDFTASRERYDLILDLAGDRSLSDLRRSLGPNGTLVMAGSSGLAASDLVVLRGFLRWLSALVLSRFVRQRLCGMIQTRSARDLTTLMGLIEAGKATPVINATYPLNEVPEAIRHFEDGHGGGRVVITV